MLARKDDITCPVSNSLWHHWLHRVEWLDKEMKGFLTHDFPSGNLNPWSESLADIESELGHSSDPTPSIPIILLSSAFGLVCGMIGLFLSYGVVGFGVEWSVAACMISTFVGLAVSSIGLSILSESSAYLGNLLFGCGLIVLSVLFFTLCTVAGALASAIILLLAAT